MLVKGVWCLPTDRTGQCSGIPVPVCLSVCLFVCLSVCLSYSYNVSWNKQISLHLRALARPCAGPLRALARGALRALARDPCGPLHGKADPCAARVWPCAPLRRSLRGELPAQMVTDRAFHALRASRLELCALARLCTFCFRWVF